MKSYKNFYDKQTGAAHLVVQELCADLHILYASWIRQHGHRRDFAPAVHHEASMVYVNYALDGHPDFGPDLIDLPTRVLPPFEEPSEEVKAGGPKRLYTDDCYLNGELDTSDFAMTMAPHFIRWTQVGFDPRSFADAAQNLALQEVYDHEICQAMGGLGGCKTAAQFLSEQRKVKPAPAEEADKAAKAEHVESADQAVKTAHEKAKTRPSVTSLAGFDVNDVRRLRPDLSEGKAQAVLHYCADNFNPTMGLTETRLDYQSRLCAPVQAVKGFLREPGQPTLDVLVNLCSGHMYVKGEEGVAHEESGRLIRLSVLRHLRPFEQCTELVIEGYSKTLDMSEMLFVGDADPHWLIPLSDSLRQEDVSFVSLGLLEG